MKRGLLIISIISTCLSYAAAQSDDSSLHEKSRIPRLNGHMFLTASHLRTSFTNTSVQADLGFGVTSPIEIPGIVIEDIEIPGFEGSILFFDMNVQYQQNFTPWLALFTSMKVGGRLGTEISTIVVDGVNTLIGGDIGWLVRIRKTQRFNISGTISVVNIAGNFVNVSEYIEEIIENNPEASVAKKVPAMSAVIGLRGAYAFNAMYGLQFHGEYAYGESLERGRSQGYFSLGVLGDLDFNPRKNVPCILHNDFIL